MLHFSYSSFSKNNLATLDKTDLNCDFFISIITDTLNILNNSAFFKLFSRAYIIDLMKQPLTKEDESFAVN